MHMASQKTIQKNNDIMWSRPPVPFHFSLFLCIWIDLYTLNKILVEVGQTGNKNESHLVKKLVTWGY